ncbi:MAG: hypothetical protein DRI81_00600 [Chloroflexi bacterium]|nr:MAG: hypothetical protein DRI81_00600 [Chloroflexota bacterium]
MKYTAAKGIADGLLQDLAPYCERVEIAGSIRRGKAEVGDIEIVAEPVLSLDLFGAPSPGPCALDGAIAGMVRSGYLGEAIKNGLRYKQLALPQGIKLDLFIVRPPAQWGVIFAIRTGPADFSRWLVTQRKLGGALPSYCRVKDGGVHHGLTGKSTPVPMPEEIDLFNFVGLDWLAPENRKPTRITQ